MAESKAGQRIEVILGAASYHVSEHIVLPAGVSLVGKGSANTHLTFVLSPGRGSPSAAITAASNTSIVNLTLTIAAATTWAPGFGGRIGVPGPGKE